MDDQPQVEQLENRIDTLESTIEKMMPSRRDALKMGGAALAGGSLMAGTASAGTNQKGTIGSASQPVDVESEDINNADTVTTDTLDAVLVNTEKLESNRLYAGSFDGSNQNARLTNALSAANDFDTIYLESLSYSSQTISKRIKFVGSMNITTAGTRIASDWTVNNNCHFMGVSAGGGDITFNESGIFSQAAVRFSSTLTAAADGVIFTSLHQGAGNIVFNSGTQDGAVGPINGKISVTDNGTNDTN